MEELLRKINEFKQERKALEKKVGEAREFLSKEQSQIMELNKNFIENFKYFFKDLYLPLEKKGQKELNLLEMMNLQKEVKCIYSNYSHSPIKKWGYMNHIVGGKKEEVIQLLDQESSPTEMFFSRNVESSHHYIYGDTIGERPYVINGTYSDRDEYNYHNFHLDLFKIPELKNVDEKFEVSLFNDLKGEPLFQLKKYLQEPEYCPYWKNALSNFPFKEKFYLYGEELPANQKLILEECKIKSKLIKTLKKIVFPKNGPEGI
ncbi:MAG: hypothetical protein NUV46_03230 [Nanoarchaeota archaeon]|nr:hypothetical protein [Nanoarchaeota archaeon]